MLSPSGTARAGSSSRTGPAPGRPSHTCTAGSAAMLLTGPRYDPRTDTSTRRRCAHAPHGHRPPRRRCRRPRAARAADRRRRSRTRRTALVTSDGAPVAMREIDGGHGGRVHALDIPAGHLVIDYIATVHGSRAVPHGGESDLLEYRRPSRYCPSDKLLAIAANEFERHRRRRQTRRRRHHVGARPARLHQRLQRPDRRRRRHAAARRGRLPRLRTPRAVAAAGPRRPRPARGRLRPRTRPRWTSTPWSRRGWTAHGGWSTPPAWPRGRRCCGSPPAATPRTPRS